MRCFCYALLRSSPLLQGGVETLTRFNQKAIREHGIEDSLVASTPVSTELAAFHLEAILATSSQMHDVSVFLAEKSMKSRVESGVTEAYPWGMGSGGLDSTAT